MRFFTKDKASSQALRFYTVESLGEKQSLTPEGFLVIVDVPIARTGTMLYGAGEIPVAANRDGMIRIHREAEDVFHPDYIASLQGKSVTNDHPPTDVIPDNWKEYEVGQVFNVRRGTDIQGDLLLADYIIKCPYAIKDVRAGKREVSVGYDAEYIEIAPGEGKQTNLIGNHVALVESGRCGPRCAIGDQKTVEDNDMKFKDEAAKFFDTKIGKILMQAFKAKDTNELEGIVKGAGSEGFMDDASHGGVHIHNSGHMSRFTDDMHEEFQRKNEEEHAAMRARLDALEGKAKDNMAAGAGITSVTPDANLGIEKVSNDDITKQQTGDDKVMDVEGVKIYDDMEKEMPPGTKDARKTKDSALLADSYVETISFAEILSPGVAIPTYDAAADARSTYTNICNLRRKSLDMAYATDEGKVIIEGIHGKQLDLPKMNCSDVRSLFRSAVTAKRVANNARQTSDRGVQQTTVAKKAGPRTQAEFNQFMRDYYAKQK